MFPKCPIVYFLILFFTTQVHAQEKCPVKFGRISPEDFNTSQFQLDTTEGAVILADVGNSYFENTSNGYFDIIFHRNVRAIVISTAGFNVANVSIPLYQLGEIKEELGDVKGVTYNMVDGKIVETKMGKGSLYETQFDEHRLVDNFTLSSVKVGSVIEYSYTVRSSFLFNLQPWSFQGNYPCLWSEYSVDIPQYFDYQTLGQGYDNFNIDTTGEYSQTFSYSRHFDGGMVGAGSTEFYNEHAVVKSRRWVMKNVPVIKDETYISSVKNYTDKIEFQMSGIGFPGQPYKSVLGNWPEMDRALLKDENFGADIFSNNGWLDEVTKNILTGTTDSVEMAKKIFAYVRDSIKCTAYKSIYLSKPLKEVYKKKSGSVADVNMLLIAMLNHAHINTFPVILSTRSHGYIQTIYPIIDRFDYIVGMALIDSSSFFLDASNPYNGFGHLPEYCYNGMAKVVDEHFMESLSFSADTLNESEVTNVLLNTDSVKKDQWTGGFYAVFNQQESSSIRTKIFKDGRDDYEKSLKSTASEDYAIDDDIKIDNLNNYESPVGVHYSFAMNIDTSAGTIYMAPVLSAFSKENPFKTSDRKYPVEMNYPIDESYSIVIAVPAGYQVDEVPKSAKASFYDTEGSFEYMVYKEDGFVTIKTHLKFNKANFKPEEYADLKGFFDYVTQKNKEQIVFKKISP